MCSSENVGTTWLKVKRRCFNHFMGFEWQFLFFFRHAKPFGINNRFFATSQSIFQIIRNAWAEESTITARNIAVGFSDDRLEASHRDPKWPPLSRDQTSRPWLDYATANSSANGGRFMANSHRRNGPRICTIGSQSPFPLISHRPGRETRIMAEKLGLWPRSSVRIQGSEVYWVLYGKTERWRSCN